MTQVLAIEIDYERCQAHGMCAEAAPAVFDLTEDTEQSLPLLDRVSGEAAVAARSAAELCPELAIRLVPVDQG